MEYNEDSPNTTHFKDGKLTPEERDLYSDVRIGFIVISCIGIVFFLVMLIIAIKIVNIIKCANK